MVSYIIYKRNEIFKIGKDEASGRSYSLKGIESRIIHSFLHEKDSYFEVDQRCMTTEEAKGLQKIIDNAYNKKVKKENTLKQNL